MYSESQDHPICETQVSEAAVVVDVLGLALKVVRAACVGDGEVSTFQVRVICSVSVRRTMILSCTPIRMK